MILSELWYNRYMKRNYRRTKTTVSMINYHFVFCPRYRRRLFLVDGLETRFKELVAKICEQSLQYNMETLNSAFPAFLGMHENTKQRLQAVGSSLPASIGF